MSNPHPTTKGPYLDITRDFSTSMEKILETSIIQGLTPNNIRILPSRKNISRFPIMEINILRNKKNTGAMPSSPRAK